MILTINLNNSTPISKPPLSYEDGKIDGVEQVFIKDGKLVPKREIFKGGAWEYGISMPKSMLMAMSPLAPTFTK
jgi:hypothetical protein